MVRIAVCGTGWVAGEYLKAIENVPNAELYGVFSKNHDFAAFRLAELAIDTRIFDSFEQMVKDPNLDAVVLCSTPDVRSQQAMLAAMYGKHLVIEKPVALDRQSLLQMTETIVKADVTTAVSFVLRWNPMFDIAKSIIENGALGRIFLAEVDYWHHIGPHYEQYRWARGRHLGGSSLLSAGCHAVDALRYFVGEVEEVFAYGCNTWSNSEYEFEPNVMAIFRLANGGVGKVSSSLECTTPYKFNIHLLGEHGSLINNQLYSKSLFSGQTDYATIPTILPDSGDVTHHPFELEIIEFVQAVENKSTTKCDLLDAAKSMELCFAIDEAVTSGKKVSLHSVG